MAKKLQLMGSFGTGSGSGNVSIDGETLVFEVSEQNGSGGSAPSTLPNALHFTGAVEASYDGSEEVTVEIPQGVEKEWKLIADVEITEAVHTVEIPTLPNGEPYEISELMLWGSAICGGTTDRGIHIKNNGTSLSQLSLAAAKAGTDITDRRFYCELAVRNGVSRGIYCVFNSEAQQSSGTTQGSVLSTKEYGDKITSVSIAIATSADSFAAGTWFKIWGR